MQDYIKKIVTACSLSKQEAIWLLEHICQEKYTTLLIKNLTPEQELLLTTYLDQIKKENKPLAYIIGWVPFLNLKINVRPPILIPRPETEEWVNQIIKRLSAHKDEIKKILDVGTGSGVIGLSLAQAFPQANVVALDINDQALQLAKENSKNNTLNNITFIKSNLFEKLENQKFDLIVSNPPYIPENVSPSLDTSVLNWEDPDALFSGKEGLDLITKLLEKSYNHIRLNQKLPFQLVIEIDKTHHEIIPALASKHRLNCSIEKDLFGNYRTAWCIKKQQKPFNY